MNQVNLAEISRFFVDILKIIIWPFVIFKLAKKFEFEIKSLISRIQGISAAGVNIDAQAQSQQEESSQESVQIEKLSKELKTQKDIQEILLKVEEDTRKSRQEYEFLFFFEKTYRLIFGSQLVILSTAQKNVDGINLALVEAIYRRTNWPSLNYTYDLYIGFLENNYLVEYDKAKNSYKISLLGSLFLQYLASNNIPINKLPY